MIKNVVSDPVPAPSSLEDRILILAPTGRDAEMTCEILKSAGLQCQPCMNTEEVCAFMREGAAAVLLTDEALNSQDPVSLLHALDSQESWSDIPLLVFPANGTNAAMLLERLGSRANVSIIERPVRIEILVNAAKSALRARRRQYDTRNLLLQLENADRQKDLFLATLSHELRTPLSAILGWSRLLQSGHLNAEKTALALQVINRNATAQSQLISDILSVSQIVAGTLRIEPLPLELDVVIRAAIDSARLSAEAKDIHMEYRVDSRCAMVGDASRLQQVVSNVLSNAIKFTPPKGHIEVLLTTVDDTCKIQIRDNGKGISASFLPYIFDHFRQADNSYTRSEGGLGLGLAIVRHLVDLHGGSVLAESLGEGHGATFTITLPAYSEHIGSTPAVTNIGIDPLLRGTRILIVDDDKDTLTVLDNVLTDRGATVIAVGSAAAALDVMSSDQADVLISDIGMPGQDGYELMLKIVAARKGKSMLPAIALTGYASQKDRERALDVGYHIHMVKPFDPRELVSAVERLLRQREG